MVVDVVYVRKIICGMKMLPELQARIFRASTLSNLQADMLCENAQTRIISEQSQWPVELKFPKLHIP